VCPPDEPEECFDLSLVPFQAGGRSIYTDRPDGFFRDEPSALRHARGAVSLSNPGRADANGSQFFVTIAPPGAPVQHLDGKYTVFAQVIAGYEIMEALGAVGRKDGTTLQRVVIEECGVLPPGWEPPAVAAASARGAAAAAAAGGWGRRAAAAPRRAALPLPRLPLLRRAPPRAACRRTAPPPLRRAACAAAASLRVRCLVL
jgi:hypothetical protein